jgi:ribosomal protein S24E
LSVQIIEEKKNDILGRKEINCIIPSSAGLLKRQDARKILSKILKINVDDIFIISLKSGSGSRDLSGLIYIYENHEHAKRQLPKHIFQRMITKEPTPAKKSEEPTPAKKSEEPTPAKKSE